MHEHGCPWDRGMLLSAGICCSVEMVEWMATNGYDFGRVNAESAYLRLALDGDTTMMRCLRDLGVAWDPARASEAFTVMCGYHCDLAVLTWLLGPGGCPVD